MPSIVIPPQYHCTCNVYFRQNLFFLTLYVNQHRDNENRFVHLSSLTTNVCYVNTDNVLNNECLARCKFSHLSIIILQFTTQARSSRDVFNCWMSYELQKTFITHWSRLTSNEALTSAPLTFITSENFKAEVASQDPVAFSSN